ncbi:type II secretion system F family protein [Planctomyces sp. SH-PL14]|uniref:type II secretion system F family protein n=1 Tax=Planctomyces sp. SH-PL14 TaxID=1632864 RepID=UPI00078D94A3|nr:type II secretion system F family protein [Planctomyces sp. SH-PL14]AMV18611.1 Type II secretion system protein F [Planctomyces sp. SH-PL14]
MLFSRQLPLPQLAIASRSLSTMLEAGIPAFRAFELTAQNSADGRLRRSMTCIVEDLKQGTDVTTAMRNQADVYPELFRNMVEIGDQTGKLPEVLRSLADHYDNSLRLKRDFTSEIMLPIFQFVAAVIIIGGLIWILGMIAELKGGSPGTAGSEEPADILGWGLQGTPGAIKWFVGWGILIGGLILSYLLLQKFFPGLRLLHRVLLQVPVIGRCMQSFALARFSWAFHLTQEAGLPVDQSLVSALNATGNAHFQAAAPAMTAGLMRGETITETFHNSGLFPRDYLQMVHVGETTGTVPEILHRLSPQFEDQARRSLKLLATTAASLVWTAVAAFIVIIVFRIAAWYIDVLEKAMDSAFGG